MNERKIVEMYESGISSPQIAKQKGVATHKIAYILHKNKVKMRSSPNKKRKYIIKNNDIFEVINTQEKAYWLGFLMADGFLNTSSPQVGLSLGYEDKNHLEKFKLFLDTNYPIRTFRATGYSTNEYHRIIMTSRKMKADLIHKGMLENKSLILEKPKHVPRDLEIHFIRGFYDGDGSLTCIRDRGPGGAWSVKVTSTKGMLDFIKKHFGKEHLSLYHKKGTSEKTFTLTMAGNIQVEKILDQMYKNSTVHLDRKYERYIEFKNSRLL